MDFAILKWLVSVDIVGYFRPFYHLSDTICYSLSSPVFKLTTKFREKFCLFDLIFYVPSTIFQFNRDGSSWVKPVLS